MDAAGSAAMAEGSPFSKPIQRFSMPEVCDRATPREGHAIRVFVRLNAAVLALCLVTFTQKGHAEQTSADAALALGVGVSDSDGAAGLNLQVNFHDPGWALRLGALGGRGSIAYLGAGKLWSGALSDSWSNALYGGLEAAATTHVTETHYTTSLTTADNWPIGGEDLCSYEREAGYGAGAGVGARIDVHFGAFMLGLHSTGHTIWTTARPAGAAILYLQLGVAFR